MAKETKKAKKEKVDYNSLDEKDKKKMMADALGALQAASPLCTSLDDAQSNVHEFDNTGCYILNALLSGELNGGFPEGRMSLLAAESSVGKSYIGLQTAARAQKAGKHVVIFDSEGAIDREFGRNLGLDTSNTTYFPIRTIEDCRNSIFKFLNFVIDNNMRGQFFILVDSLGNMISEGEMDKQSDGKTSVDMGTRARAMKSFLQTCINMSTTSNTTIVCTNHIYDNPGQMYPSIIRSMPGGKCVTYLPSTILQLSAVNVKDDDDKRKIGEEASIGGKGLVGKAVTGLSVKNRICKPFITADMFISFQNGLSKYYGLLELSQDFDIIENKAGRFYLTQEAKDIFDELKNYVANPDVVKGSYFWEEYLLGLQVSLDALDAYLPKGEKDKTKTIGTRTELIKDGDFWEKFMPVLQFCIDKSWKYTSPEARQVGQSALDDAIESYEEDI